jgi:hypothetical protein
MINFVGQQVVNALKLVAFNNFINYLNLFVMADKVNTSFDRVRDGDLVNDSYRVIDNMTDNSFFTERIADVEKLKKVTQEYQAALYDAAGRDQKLVSIKNDKRAIVRSILTPLAEYVNAVSKGDRTMLLSSGFKLARRRNEGVELGQIEKVELYTDTPQTAIVSIKRVSGAKAYIHEYTTGVVTNETVWLTRTIVEPTYTYTGLQSGVKHSFRVIAIGQGGRSVFSPIVSRYIQ